jgi:hypothetical protein
MSSAKVKSPERAITSPDQRSGGKEYIITGLDFL